MLFNLIKVSPVLDKEKHFDIVTKVTKLLDTEFKIWNFKFGVDPIIGLIPGLGDIVTSIISCYIIFVAIIYKIPPFKIVRMVFNIIFDLIIGSVPLFGDIFDFVMKPNVMNLKILQNEIEASYRLE